MFGCLIRGLSMTRGGTCEVFLITAHKLKSVKFATLNFIKKVKDFIKVQYFKKYNNGIAGKQYHWLEWANFEVRVPSLFNNVLENRRLLY